MGFLIFLPLVLMACAMVVFLKAAFMLTGLWMLMWGVIGLILYCWCKNKGFFAEQQNQWMNTGIRVIRILSLLAIGACLLYGIIALGLWILLLFG